MLVETEVVQVESAKKEPNNTYIIDAHSHFGKDGFWSNHGSYEEYLDYALKLGINEVYSMAVPCPVINRDDGSTTMLSYYEINNKGIQSYRVDEKRGKKVMTAHSYGVNPYEEANNIVYNICKKNDSNIKFNYVPLIHPYYYSYDDLVIHKKRGAKMLKIHGVACGVIPKNINRNFLELIEHFETPVIVHTDYSKDDNILSRNSAVNWLECFQNYNIKVYFTHAARLSDSVIKLVNSDDRYIVGIGPDKLLSIKGQNEQSPQDYLDYCFSNFDINKIVFDIDYPWNIQDINNYMYDWESIYRVKYRLDKTEKEKIFSENMKNFVRKRR